MSPYVESLQHSVLLAEPFHSNATLCCNANDCTFALSMLVKKGERQEKWTQVRDSWWVGHKQQDAFLESIRRSGPMPPSTFKMPPYN